jgi:hypothetical protein
MHAAQNMVRFWGNDMRKTITKARRALVGRHYKSGFGRREPACEKIIPEQQDAAIS